MRRAANYARFLLPLMLLSATAACSVTSGQESAGEYVDSTAITAQVKSKLASQGSVELASQINVTTVDQVVQLAGFVETEAAKQRAESIAWSVNGVKAVENDLIVSP